MPRKRPLVQYALLAFLLAVTLVYQVRHTAFVVDMASGRLGAVVEPFGIRDDRPVVDWTASAAERAGLRKGDTVLGVNGVAYVGRGVLIRALLRARPGEVVRVQARRPGEATERSLAIRLTGWGNPERLLPDVVFGLVVPYCCLALGFWVAFARPRLPMA